MTQLYFVHTDVFVFAKYAIPLQVKIFAFSNTYVILPLAYSRMHRLFVGQIFPVCAHMLYRSA